MTFTIDANLLGNTAQLASPGALTGIGIVLVVMYLFWNLAKWSDDKAGRPATYTDKQGSSFILLVIIVIAIVTVAFAGQSTGHTQLITGPGQARMW